MNIPLPRLNLSSLKIRSHAQRTLVARKIQTKIFSLTLVFSRRIFRKECARLLQWQVFKSDDNLTVNDHYNLRPTPASAVAQHAISEFLTLFPK